MKFKTFKVFEKHISDVLSGSSNDLENVMFPGFEDETHIGAIYNDYIAAYLLGVQNNEVLNVFGSVNTSMINAFNDLIIPHSTLIKHGKAHSIFTHYEQLADKLNASDKRSLDNEYYKLLKYKGVEYIMIANDKLEEEGHIIYIKKQDKKYWEALILNWNPPVK